MKLVKPKSVPLSPSMPQKPESMDVVALKGPSPTLKKAPPSTLLFWLLPPASEAVQPEVEGLQDGG